MEKQRAIDLLKRLTEAHGAPGSEDAVRQIFRDEVDGEIITDRLGSIYGVKPGSADSPRIMLAGHMDEVGFIVQSFTSDGFIRFAPLGGWWGHTLLAQRVRILTRNQTEIIGVITSKPPHFLAKSEREKVMNIDKMYIDVGAKDIDDLKHNFGIRLGDPIVPFSEFTQLHNPDLLLCKAFDNRNGTGLAIHVLQELKHVDHPNRVYSGANVQEEVGVRGAETAAALINPDVGIVLEGTPADDTPGFGKDEQQAVLGQGIQIRMFDPTAIMNRELAHFVIDVAEQCNINHQVAVRRSGGTDARALQRHHVGVPVVVLGVPSRYIHTHNSIIDINDYLSGLELLVEVIKRLDASTVARFTAF